MSNSQEQSLDEGVVFLPASESSPDFLHSEAERLAVERLLNAGPEAFYSAAGSEHSSCFLSQEEVTDITNWAQDYQLSPLPNEELGEDGSGLDVEGYSSTYYPAHSDTPAPSLALGWPERSPWGQEDSAKVYTSPAAEGEPPVRELIRQHLQAATQVIAIVTDRLTDCAVIEDLHGAASRGVPVYLILNKRSTQENHVHRLRHPNIQVRVLGGKSFCSRAGRMVMGEMKDKFVLVDLQTVIHGSYSLTWSDARLHRQLVTVLTGSVLDSFDQEFRILYAASSPVPEPRRTSCSQMTNHMNNFSDVWFPKHLSYSDTETTNPPSPPGDTLLDWEAMGVTTGGCSVPHSPLERHEDVCLNNVGMDKKNKIVDTFFSNKHLELDKKRLSEPPPPIYPVGNYVSHLLTSYSKIKPTMKEPPSPEIRKETWTEPVVERTVARQISQENTKQDKCFKRPEMKPEPLHNVNVFSHIKTRHEVKEESTVKEVTSGSKDPSGFKVENTPSSRKPVILRVPHTQDTRSLSDILNRIKMKQSPHEQPEERQREQPEERQREQPEERQREQPEERQREQPKEHQREQYQREHPKEHQREQPEERQREQYQREQHQREQYQRERSKTAFSELNWSLVDVSVKRSEPDEKTTPVPRFRAGTLDVESLSPALALMQKRNDHIRSSMSRVPLKQQPGDRPRSFAFSPHWKGSLSELDMQGQQH